MVLRRVLQWEGLECDLSWELTTAESSPAAHQSSCKTAFSKELEFIQKIQQFYPIKFLLIVDCRVPTGLYPKFWDFVVGFFFWGRDKFQYIPGKQELTSWFQLLNLPPLLLPDFILKILVSFYNDCSICNCFIPLFRFKFLNWALCFSKLQIFLSF